MHQLHRKVTTLNSRNGTHVALYLVNLVQCGLSFSTIQSVMAFRFFIGRAAFWIFVSFSGILQVCKKVCAAPVKDRRRMPVLSEHLRALVGRFAGFPATLSETFVFVYLVLRVFCPSMSCVTCDIHFEKTYFSLFIPRSKTDQYFCGCTQLIARTGNPTCPYGMLKT
jgi:hypothetical protein